MDQDTDRQKVKMENRLSAFRHCFTEAMIIQKELSDNLYLENMNLVCLSTFFSATKCHGFMKFLL